MSFLTAMAIERVERPVAAEVLRDAACHLLEASTVCSIANCRARLPRIREHGVLRVEPLARTCVDLRASRNALARNIRANKTTAVAVYDSDQRWGSPTAESNSSDRQRR